jgi:hypothetical protein
MYVYIYTYIYRERERERERGDRDTHTQTHIIKSAILDLVDMCSCRQGVFLLAEGFTH